MPTGSTTAKYEIALASELDDCIEMLTPANDELTNELSVQTWFVL